MPVSRHKQVTGCLDHCRADLDPVSPDVSPFRRLASQGWQGSVPQQHMTAEGVDRQSARITAIAEASAAEQQAAAPENGHAHEAQPSLAGQHSADADWTGSRQQFGHAKGASAQQLQTDQGQEPGQQAAGQGNFVAAEQLR